MHVRLFAATAALLALAAAVQEDCRSNGELIRRLNPRTT